MKMFIKFLTIGMLLIAIHSLITIKVKATTFSYPNYDVEVQINKDSTFIVTEKADYILNGEAHGLRRDLTLYDSKKTQLCINNPALTCGGFDRIKILSVTDNTGQELNNEKFKFYEVNENGKRSARFEWTIWPDGKEVNDYKVGWTIQYKVYGGIQKIGNNPYFYWNMLPDDRSGAVSNSHLKILLPSGSNLSASNLIVNSDYKYQQNLGSKSIEFNLRDLNSFGNFTVGYKFDPSEIILPGSINYTVISPKYGLQIYLDGEQVGNNSTSSIKSIESGKHLLEIKHIGYQTYSKELEVTSGETIDINTDLEPEVWMNFILFINNLLVLLGCGLIPTSLILVYIYYRKHGSDKNMPKTIIPLFAPPKDTPPYLLGTLKDESVDKEDIVGSIIDLAYRGFIKIKELKKGSNYELTKLNKDDSELNSTEKQLLDAIFNGQDVRETKSMQYYFPSKYQKLTNQIYNEVVNKGFFSRSPRSTIGIYIGIGFVLLFLGGGALVILSLALTQFLGYLTFFSIGAAIATSGIAFLIIAKFMPAKTEKGSKVFADILGFKMYLHTAERFRLQNLGPEEFEKHLSYAVVFQIEKEWAKKFEGIYNSQPEWFEGNYSAWDVWVISNFVGSFRTASVSAMTPYSSNNASGGGWSGSSGSFGGFSGGGGGGGSSGAW